MRFKTLKLYSLFVSCISLEELELNTDHYIFCKLFFDFCKSKTSIFNAFRTSLLKSYKSNESEFKKEVSENYFSETVFEQNILMVELYELLRLLEVYLVSQHKDFRKTVSTNHLNFSYYFRND